MSDLKALETSPHGTRVDLAEFLGAVKFNDQGLVPAIAQDSTSGTVLMLAWMNRDAIDQTLASGLVTYFSRPICTILIVAGILTLLKSLHSAFYAQNSKS